MLELRNVSKTFNANTINEKRALSGLNLKLEEGDFVTVIGGNGAGKSTMMNAICGAWPLDEGQVLIDGKDVTRLPDYKRAAYLGRVFQDPMMGTAADMEIEGTKGEKLFVRGVSIGGGKVKIVKLKNGKNTKNF